MDLNERIDRLYRRLSSAEEDNTRLKEQLKNFDRVKAILGKDTIEEALRKAKQKEQMEDQKRNRKHVRDVR
ncbi:MAG: hypothetical protein LIO96_00995 [Lachnospiraceae bacterium]|nr:hypothetical protein [Lachnospiraceae bacterium]MCC8155117.1 hypothetical protein [Tannerellaceae bacterium]